MKFSFSVCLVFVVFSMSSFAQREKKDCIGIPYSHKLNQKVPTDTLKPASFISGTPTLYKYVEGGYSFGTNKLSDRAFAQVYKVTTSYIVNGIALWVGAKEQIGSADTLNVIVYKLNGPGTASDGPVNNAPNSIDEILKIPVNLIDTSGLTFLTFPESYIAYVDYAIGIEFYQMGNDTIGLIATKDGDANRSELSWNKCSDGTWQTILDSINWGMDIDLGIFMIVDNSSANINDNYFLDGIKLSQNQPNPSSNNTLIQYEIKNNADVILEIFDMAGKSVISKNDGKQLSGKHNIIVDINKLNNGTYYYSLKAGNHRLTKKMIVSK